MGKKVVTTTVPGGPIVSSAIVHLRGTSGSGKTTAMRHLIDSLSDLKPVARNGATKTLVYRGMLPIIDANDEGEPEHWVRTYILGDYTEGRGAAGCDTISTVQQVIDAVEKYGSRSNAIVVFEGLLLAHSWGALGEYVHPRWGERYVNAFLDTPEDKCISRVTARRAARGQDTEGDRAAKIEKNIRADYYRVELCHKRVIARGGVLVDINHKLAKGEFLSLVTNTAKKFCL